MNEQEFTPEGLVIQGITVTRRMSDDGTETYAVEYQGEVGWLEGLGLLEAAKFHHYDQCMAGWRDDQ